MNRLMQRLCLDPILFSAIVLLCMISLLALYSAGGQETELIIKQSLRLALGFGVLLVTAQISPATWHKITPWFYGLGLLVLIVAFFYGVEVKGAQRWINLGLFHFQPSELIKLALPLMLARYCSEHEIPLSHTVFMISTVLIAIPFLLIAQQPDLGTALLTATSGFFVIFLAGVRWKVITTLAITAIASLPAVWYFALHDFQKQRISTLLYPQNDPLGSGWHIIQAKIAIGSGGLYGKGWLNGTQSQLEFLPERHTDSIAAVIGEEMGLLGLVGLIAIYLLITARGLYIATYGQTLFSQLLAGSLSLIFFLYVFVNIGMVSGILPVVGVPLPLISYGGTSTITLMAGFGMIMSIHTHKKLFHNERG